MHSPEIQRSRSSSISSDSVDYSLHICGCNSPPFESFNFEEAGKGTKESHNRTRISILPAFILLILASCGGFFLGRHASSFRVILPSLPASSLPNSFSSSSVQQSGKNGAIYPFMAQFWLDRTLRKSRASRSNKKSTIADKELVRRKRFAAYAIHPALLSVLPIPTSIAIAVNWHYDDDDDDDGDTATTARSSEPREFAGDVLLEVLNYESIERITLILVDRGDASEKADAVSKCPASLAKILTSTGRQGIKMECYYVGPFYGYKVELLNNKHHDVSVVLADCGIDQPGSEDSNSKWEADLYATTDSVAVKCIGKIYPLDHSVRFSREIDSSSSRKVFSSNIDRIERFFVPNVTEYPSADSFLHATDYDIFDQLGSATQFAVGFRSITKGLEQWRLPEANYQVAMHQRWRSSTTATTEDTRFFEAADMLRIQFPSRQSALSSCEHNKPLIEKDEDKNDIDDLNMFCETGLDPFIQNLPAENFYVAKSSVGENAGRGVFASVDVDELTYLMAEKIAHDVVFSFRGFGIIEGMVDEFCLSKEQNNLSNRSKLRLDSFRCIPAIFYDAYGYNSISTGLPVNSGINVFINHGCNGTWNVACEDIEEGEVILSDDGKDPDPETFEIPYIFWKTKLYNANLERNEHLQRFDFVDEDAIPTDVEILDNYLGLGGKKYFLVQTMKVIEQCAGVDGAVLDYEEGINHNHKYDLFGDRFVMDVDDVVRRRLDSQRRITSVVH